MLPGSTPKPYLIAGLATPANRITALLAVGALLAVALVARVPLSPGFVLDLKERDRFGGLRQATYLDFSSPTRLGRLARGPTARAVLNRPLPSAFTLTIEGQTLGSHRAPLQVSVGDSHHIARFDETPTVRTFLVENPAGSREIVFRTRPPRHRLDVSIRSIRIEQPR